MAPLTAEQPACVKTGADAPNQRGDDPKLSSLRSSWRHLRHLLLHSPKHLFILPGLLTGALGAVASLTVLTRLALFERQWDLHTLIGGSLLLIVGSQLVGLGVCAQTYAAYFMGVRDRWFERARAKLRLEHGLTLGSAVALVGLAAIAAIAADWINRGFGSLGLEYAAMCAATLVVLGIQIVFTSFLLSILGLRRNRC
jgi:hypothetical protein